MSVPLARTDPRLRRFPLRRRKIHVHGDLLRPVVPQSSQALLVRSADRARAAAAGDLPLWADLWPASVALARRLAAGPDLSGQTVADLGCGLGLAGLAAGRRGASLVFLDRSPDALAFAGFNAGIHDLRDYRCQEFDWAEDELPAEVGMLLMADLLYAYKHLGSIRRHVEQVLGRGGVVLCADPYRPTADDLFHEFFERWPASSLEEREAEDPGAGGRVTVRIVELRGGAA